MVKSEKIKVEELLNLLKSKKAFVDELQHKEAVRFINIPKSFVSKGCKHDSNSSLLADVSAFMDEAINQLKEVVDDF